MQDPREMIRILLADSYEISRRGLRILLEAQPGFCVVGEASDSVRTVSLARELRPDIVLLDLSISRNSAQEALRDITGLGPCVRVVVLAAEIDSAQTARFMQLGARALLL